MLTRFRGVDDFQGYLSSFARTTDVARSSRVVRLLGLSPSMADIISLPLERALTVNVLHGTNGRQSATPRGFT